MPYRNSKWQTISPLRSAPAFNLTDAKYPEVEVTLSQLDHPRIVLIFIPGVWAPWCRKFLLELDEQIHEFEEQKILPLVIVSQNKDQLWKYTRANRVELPVLADPYGIVAKRFGVFDEHISEPMKLSKPAVFILNHKKQIQSRFIGRHLMDRPQAAEIIEKAWEIHPETQMHKKGLFTWLFRSFKYATD